MPDLCKSPVCARTAQPQKQTPQLQRQGTTSLNPKDGGMLSLSAREYQTYLRRGRISTTELLKKQRPSKHKQLPFTTQTF